MLETLNPMLRSNTFIRFKNPESFLNEKEKQESMTLNGVASKTMLLLLITAAATILSWNILYQYNNQNLNSITPYFCTSTITCVIIVILVIFNQKLASKLAYIYAIFEGIFIAIASIYVDTVIPGLIYKATCLTFGTLFCVLYISHMKIIKINKKGKLGILSAIGAIIILSIVNKTANLLGHPIPFLINNIGIDYTINILLVILTSCAIVSDFSTIKQGCDIECPKYMEWYCSLSLIVTMVWIYVAIIWILIRTI